MSISDRIALLNPHWELAVKQFNSYQIHAKAMRCHNCLKDALLKKIFLLTMCGWKNWRYRVGIIGRVFTRELCLITTVVSHILHLPENRLTLKHEAMVKQSHKGQFVFQVINVATKTCQILTFYWLEVRQKRAREWPYGASQDITTGSGDFLGKREAFKRLIFER